MEKNKPKGKPIQLPVIWIILTIILVAVNLMFLLLNQTEAKTIRLLKQELLNLRKQQQIINSASQIYQQYQDEIEIISSVFPNEETIAEFIKTLEQEIRQVTSVYSFKFNAVTPIKEQKLMYLPLSVSLKTDLNGLHVFLNRLEHLPYMTHITQITTKTAEGFTAEREMTLMLKVYVQTPFALQ